MKIILILLLLQLPPLSRCSGAEENCENISGLWSTHASSDLDYYREQITQDGCNRITIVTFASGSKIGQKTEIKMNNEWACERGNPNNIRCHKGEWKNGKLLITEATFDEGCLYIYESYLENKDTKRTDSKASCPEHKGNFGYGATWVRRVKDK